MTGAFVGKKFAFSRLPWATGALVCLAIWLYVSPYQAETYSLRRDALEQGAWWLLVTGHFTHWDASHFLWDVLVFAFLGARCELFSRKAFWWVVLGGTFAISCAFLIWHPQLHSYRGLSGVDSALFALLLVFLWRRRCHMALWPKVLLTLGFLSKMVLEIATDTPLFVATAGTSFVTVPTAHVVGALWGAVAGCFFGLAERKQKKAGLDNLATCAVLEEHTPRNQPLATRFHHSQP